MNHDKSARIHVKNRRDERKDSECTELKVDKWSVKKKVTGDKVNLSDVYEGQVPLKSVNNYLYLGNNIQADANNDLTVKLRVAKGQGAANEILQILDGVFFGDSFIAAYKLLRSSKLLSILTYNMEVVHGLTNMDIKYLDQVDLFLAQKVLKLSSKSSRCLILLELQIMPVEFVIKCKRINYLHFFLNLTILQLQNGYFLNNLKPPSKETS